MIYYKCDQTGNEHEGHPKVKLIGFPRYNDSRILLPDCHINKDFESREAFIEWMKEALEQEGFDVINKN
jgi:peptide subunit release factor 1 (eRF1)